MLQPYIYAFLAAAECGSFTKAASALYVTPASIMKQMNALEEEIGVKLLERTYQGIRLTEAGQIFYDDIKEIESACQKAVQNANEAVHSKTKEIRLGVSVLNPCTTLINLWDHVKDKNEDFNLKIVPFSDNRNTVLHVLESLGEEIDIIVGTGGSRSWGKRADCLQIGTYRMCVNMNRNHPLAQKEVLEIEDLYGYTLWAVKEGDSPWITKIRSYLAENHPQIIQKDAPYYYDTDVFNECERNGDLLLTLTGWDHIHPSLVLKDVNWEFDNPLVIWYSKKPSKEVSEFIETIKNSLNKDHSLFHSA